MTDGAISAMAGPAALPRKNGELVFKAPWEGRAFGLAVALTEAGAYDWEAFRERLIGEIDRADEDDGTHYYERWLASLERVLVESEMISTDELAERARELAAHDEHEHDHDHDHTHDHDHDHAHMTREVTT